jgi:Fe-S-cluster containining protein
MEVPCIGDHDIAGHLTETDADGYWRMRRLDDGWCAALDRREMNCSIYDLRPLPCRELAVGGPDCLAARQRLAEDAGQMV